jgi:hypothetical protein
MAVDPSDNVNYFVSVPLVHKEYLGGIRNWENLRVGFEEDLIWIKDFHSLQVDSIELKTIPFKTIYYLSGNKLFLQGSLLPERNIPSLLWTPIEKALPVTLPAFNHNYFGLHDSFAVKLVRSDVERDAYGLIVSLKDLEAFILSAAAIRLQHLTWAMLDDEQAIILGRPILPLHGSVFWRDQHFLFPAGYQLQLSTISDILQKRLNEEEESWIVWNSNGEYWKLNKSLLKPLSISSFRLSLKFLHGAT